MAAVLLLGCSPAWAHGGLGDGKSLWGGASHFLTSPLSLASMVGLVAALVGIRERLSLLAAAVAGAGAGIASALTAYAPAYVAPGAVVAVGLCAVTGRTLPNAAALLVAAIAGVGGGLAADLDAPSLPGGIGIAGAMLFIVVCALAALHDLAGMPRLQTVLPVARRVVGSWVAAMGLLMTTLAIHLIRK